MLYFAFLVTPSGLRQRYFQSASKGLFPSLAVSKTTSSPAQAGREVAREKETCRALPTAARAPSGSEQVWGRPRAVGV